MPEKYEPSIWGLGSNDEKCYFEAIFTLDRDPISSNLEEKKILAQVQLQYARCQSSCLAWGWRFLSCSFSANESKLLGSIDL